MPSACASARSLLPAKVHIARPPAQRFRGRACSATVGGRPRWSPELAAGLRERSRAENRAAPRSQSTAERPTSTARSTCDKSGPVRPLRGLEGRTSSGWNGLKLGDRARAQCAPPRRVLLPPARTAAMLRTNGTNAPTHARAHRRRPSKRRATPSPSRAALAATAGAPGGDPAAAGSGLAKGRRATGPSCSSSSAIHDMDLYLRLTPPTAPECNTAQLWTEPNPRHAAGSGCGHLHLSLCVSYCYISQVKFKWF